MELGALVCTARNARAPLPDRRAVRLAAGRQPAHDGPPRRGQTYAGTDRQVRGKLLAVLRGPCAGSAGRAGPGVGRTRPAGPGAGRAGRRRLVEPLAPGMYRLPVTGGQHVTGAVSAPSGAPTRPYARTPPPRPARPQGTSVSAVPAVVRLLHNRRTAVRARRWLPRNMSVTPLSLMRQSRRRREANRTHHPPGNSGAAVAPGGRTAHTHDRRGHRPRGGGPGHHDRAGGTARQWPGACGGHAAARGRGGRKSDPRDGPERPAARRTGPGVHKAAAFRRRRGGAAGRTGGQHGTRGARITEHTTQLPPPRGAPAARTAHEAPHAATSGRRRRDTTDGRLSGAVRP